MENKQSHAVKYQNSMFFLTKLIVGRSHREGFHAETVKEWKDAQVCVGSRRQRLLARLNALTRVVHRPPAA
ncbi:hypothetical protein QQF64_029210 [Cirrhinus molitorella]|uniref:Uncharacterized protein n=1 Tax=Cirrhinus molitorella TaxID=172907 RepID=A0ABR3N8R1_9TELE